MFFESPANRARFAMFAKLARELVSVSSFAYKDNNNVSILCFFNFFTILLKICTNFVVCLFTAEQQIWGISLSLSL